MKKAIKNTIITLIWIVLVGGFFLAFALVNNLTEPKNLIPYLKVKSQEVQSCVDSSLDVGMVQCSWSIRVGSYLHDENSINQFNQQTGLHLTGKNLGIDPSQVGKGIKGTQSKVGTSSDTASPKKEEVLKDLSSLSAVPNYPVNTLVVKDWGEWTKNGCSNTRKAVLAKSATKVKLLDEKSKETKEIDKPCSVISGEWTDAFSGDKIKDVGQTKVVQIVDIKTANAAGGNTWNKDKKQAFFNDEENLAVVSEKTSQDRGSKTPSQWMAKESCSYAKSYVKIVKKYGLFLQEADKATLTKAISSCPT